jgi:hypothetical protein
MILLGFAIGANQPWLDRHFRPPFFITRREYTQAEFLVRGVLASMGAAFALLWRRRIGRFVARVPTRTLVADAGRILLALALAVGTSEWVLRRTFRHSSEEEPASQVPYRQLDSRVGWLFVPGRTGRDKVAGRTIEYSFNDAGYRVRQAGDQIDFEKPSILFAGESIMVGQGLTWEETVPAQVQALTGIQSANLAVHGFATDQAYLRLTTELPRFRRPVAVVSLFAPFLFDRNMDQDRPHLGPDLTWLPPKPRWRLAMIASWLAPYRSTEELERGIAMTSAVLRATVDLAHAHGAAAIIVVPQFLPEDPTERLLRRRILDQSGVPNVWVGLDPEWRLPIDRHPDPRGARAIAAAVADRLRESAGDQAGASGSLKSVAPASGEWQKTLESR